MDIDDIKKSTLLNVPSHSNFNAEPSKKNVDCTMVTFSSSESLDRNAFVPSQPIYEPVWR